MLKSFQIIIITCSYASISGCFVVALATGWVNAKKIRDAAQTV